MGEPRPLFSVSTDTEKTGLPCFHNNVHAYRRGLLLEGWARDGWGCTASQGELLSLPNRKCVPDGGRAQVNICLEILVSSTQSIERRLESGFPGSNPSPRVYNVDKRYIRPCYGNPGCVLRYVEYGTT